MKLSKENSMTIRFLYSTNWKYRTIHYQGNVINNHANQSEMLCVIIKNVYDRTPCLL